MTTGPVATGQSAAGDQRHSEGLWFPATVGRGSDREWAETLWPVKDSVAGNRYRAAFGTLVPVTILSLEPSVPAGEGWQTW